MANYVIYDVASVSKLLMILILLPSPSGRRSSVGYIDHKSVELSFVAA